MLVVGAVKGLVNLGKRGFVRGGSDAESSVQKRLSFWNDEIWFYGVCTPKGCRSQGVRTIGFPSTTKAILP